MTRATHPGGGEGQRDHASARVGDRAAASPTRAALAPCDTIRPRCRGGRDLWSVYGFCSGLLLPFVSVRSGGLDGASLGPLDSPRAAQLPAWLTPSRPQLLHLTRAALLLLGTIRPSLLILSCLSRCDLICWICSLGRQASLGPDQQERRQAFSPFFSHARHCQLQIGCAGRDLPCLNPCLTSRMSLVRTRHRASQAGP